MPSLSRMFSLINQKTAFVFTPDEVYQALDEAGLLVYQKVLKENRGFFVKIDETSLVLTPGTPGEDQTYTLPDDCTEILHLAERLADSPMRPWNPMIPTIIGRALKDDGWHGFVNWDGFGANSSFKYAPYLAAVDTAGQFVPAQPQPMSIAVSPTVDQQRATQLVYAAKWLPIHDSSSELMLPEEGTWAMYNGAMASLTADIDDTRSGDFAQKSQMQLDAFLQWVADRQLQQGMQVHTDLL